MDRRRQLAQLALLKAMQHLLLANARVSLAGAIDDLHAAEGRTRDCARALDLCESEFDAIVGGTAFDPEALQRAGQAIMIAEEGLGGQMENETLARHSENEMRIDWHRERLRLTSIERRHRDVERKSAQIKEDKAGIDALALAAGREQRS